MHMKEATETSRRIVNMEQTKRIIHFDQNKETNLEPFPFSPTTSNRVSPRQRVPPPPTPTKFIPGEFRESDYDSEIENARITPLWNANLELRYRHVEPPRPGRSASVPRSYERIISPMHFDRGPEMPSKTIFENSRNCQQNLTEQKSYQTQTLNRYSSSTKKLQHCDQSMKTTRDDMNLEVGSPPKYSYIGNQARAQANEIGTTVRQKTAKFLNDISEDYQQQRNTTHETVLGSRRWPDPRPHRPRR